MKLSKISWLLFGIILLAIQQEQVLGGSNREISSSAFKDREKIPIQYVMPGAGGKNISVPLSWKNIPYQFTLYALSQEKLNLGANTSLSAFKKALEGKILGSTTLTGKYGR